MPGWRLWRAVAANRVPANAVAAIAVLAWALMLPTLINGAIGYLVGTSIAVIGLYIAFALPIFRRIRVGERFESGAWNLGRHYRWIAPLAVAWIAVICVLFLLPVSPKGIPGAPDFDWKAWFADEGAADWALRYVEGCCATIATMAAAIAPVAICFNVALLLPLRAWLTCQLPSS